MRLELTGFAPDADPQTPGILTDCDAIVPTSQGLAAAYSAQATALPALAATPTSAYVAELLDGNRRTIAATATALYEAGASSWTDRSRVGGYSGSYRTRFATFGNVVLATNRSEAIQAASVGAAFADIATAPKALVLVTAAGFVMALNVSAAAYGDLPDGWHCSALRDHTSWTLAAATQCTEGRLLDSPGAIVAGAALGSDVVAYKANSMYLGRYVGPPLVWEWRIVPGGEQIGCAGAEAVVVADTRHYFVGPQDFYVFDGTTPQAIGQDVREWFFATLNPSYRDRIVGVFDKPRDLIYWHFPSTASTSGACDTVLTYNVKTNRWGKQSLAISTALLYSGAQITFDGIGSSYATYDDLPAIAYDSPFWLAGQGVPAVFVGATLNTLTGAPGANYLTTGDFGDFAPQFLRRVTPRYRSDPATGGTTPSARNYYKDSLGAALTADATAPLARSRFDFRRAARWHRIRLDHPGAMTVNGLDVELVGGTRE